MMKFWKCLDRFLRVHFEVLPLPPDMCVPPFMFCQLLRNILFVGHSVKLLDKAMCDFSLRPK
jgi:hypothetical protein